MKRIRLSILIPLLLIMSAVASSTLLFWEETRVANRSIQQAGIANLHASLTHLQNMLNTQLAAESLEDARLSLSVSALHPGIHTLLLVDENNSVMLANRYIWEGSRAAQVSGYNDLIAQQVRQIQASSVSLNAGLLSGYYPVTIKLVEGGLGANRIGVLFVEYDLAPQLAQARRNAVERASLVGGMMIAVAIAVALLLHMLVSRRVEKIVDASKRFAAGDMEARVHLQGRDELAELGHAFDDMAGQRKLAQEEIRKFNQELEQRVNERTAKLEAANKELEAFSYSVSHDLRSPLRAIDGFSAILLEDYAGKLDDEGKRLLNVVHDNTIRMGQLIDDILKFSRTGRLEITFSEIDMEKLAHSVVEELQPADGKLQVEIEVLPPARGDRAMLHQVFVNLLSNAIKFSRTRETPRIKLGGFIEGDEAVYFVRDNGAGFDMRYADKLFGVFQRLHREGEFEGTGIGLAIVKRIVTRHGGRVWAEGKVDEGATIYFALPIKESGHE